MQTHLVVLKAKELPASRCNQVREKVEHHKEEKGKERLFCQSKITIHQGTQVHRRGHPEQDEAKVNGEVKVNEGIERTFLKSNHY